MDEFCFITAERKIDFKLLDVLFINGVQRVSGSGFPEIGCTLGQTGALLFFRGVRRAHCGFFGKIGYL